MPNALPPAPAAWLAPMPADTLARLIAGVRSKTEPYPNEAEVARYREAIGTDTDEYEVQQQ